jgi:hypothetical protein
MSAQNPTDQELLARLASHPPERWRALFAAVDALTPEDLDVPWTEPEPITPGTITLPYPRYSDAVLTVHGLLAEIDAITPLPWTDWGGAAGYRGQFPFEAPAADAVRLITAIFRGERFCDGTIAAALADGTLLAALRRLRHWFEHER